MNGKSGETSRNGARRTPISSSTEEKKEAIEKGRKIHIQRSTNVETDDKNKNNTEILERERLDISSKPLPPIEGLIEAFSQLNNLQRLDMSDMKSSIENDNPNGLETLQWIEKAVAKSKIRNKNGSSVFGQQLTWLKFSDNPSLGKYAGQNAWLGLDQFSKLTVLNAASCDIPVPPPTSTLLAWQSLGALVLGHNAITTIPHFPSMPQLNTIVLSHNQIKSLPLDMPANLPSLKKLSITHNKLQWSNKKSPLPDFSLCSHLREVRISGNAELKRLPDHLKNWGKGVGKDSKGTGLETFEAGDCGLDDWISIAPLMEAGEDSQNENGAKSTDAIHPSRRRRVRGLTTLSLRGNEVTKIENYQEKILNIHSGLRVLDSVKLQADQRKEEETRTTLDGETLKNEQDTSHNAMHRSKLHSTDPFEKKQYERIGRIGHEKKPPQTLRSRREGARPLQTNEANENSKRPGKEEALPRKETIKSKDRDLHHFSAKDIKMPDRSKESQNDETAPEDTMRKRQHKRGGRGKKKKNADDGEKEEAENTIRDPFLLPVEKSAKNTTNDDEHLARIRARAGPAIAEGPSNIVKKKKGGLIGSEDVDLKVKKIKPQKELSSATSEGYRSINSQNSKKRKAWDEDANDAENVTSQKRGKQENINKQSLDAEPVSKELTSVSGIVNVEKRKKNGNNQSEKGKTKVPFNVAKKSLIGKTNEPSIGLGGAWN